MVPPPVIDCATQRWVKMRIAASVRGIICNPQVMSANVITDRGFQGSGTESDENTVDRGFRIRRARGPYDGVGDVSVCGGNARHIRLNACPWDQLPGIFGRHHAPPALLLDGAGGAQRNDAGHRISERLSLPAARPRREVLPRASGNARGVCCGVHADTTEKSES